MENRTFQPIKLATITSLFALFSDILLYPIDTIATRVKSYSHSQTQFRTELKHILKHESYHSLYRGVSTTFTTSFLPTMIYFVIYENLNYYGKKVF
jgi:hypothetical protein